MSIATDEAENKYPAPTDADDPMYKYVEPMAGCTSAKRQGYVAGRTADVTDAEVKSAMNELYGHGYCCREGDPIVCMCGANLKDRHEYDTHLLRAILEEARKAVME